MGAHERLRIYLRDHHAGSVAGHELAKRSAKANKGTEFGTLLETLQREIYEDQKTLEQVMRRLGLRPAKGKDMAGWAAEKFGRLKLNGSVTQYSPLSRVLEFEALSIWVQSKKATWRTLKSLENARLPRDEIEALETRAEDQQRRIDEARLEAARIAFTEGGSAT